MRAFGSVLSSIFECPAVASGLDLTPFLLSPVLPRPAASASLAVFSISSHF